MTPPAAETALPLPLTALVGREREVDEVLRLLDSTRLLTLTGAGGSGKTRLALAAAARFAEGGVLPVAWVELAPLDGGELVPRQVAAALGVREGDRSAAEAVVEALRERPALLVLDNCEHVVDACARHAELLLRSCPGARVLATSREALGIGGERAWLVPALALPGEDDDRPDRVGGSAAVRLFVERARDAVPGFALTEANAAAVGRICRRLDGLPLAIELAAARARVLAPEQIADRLGDAFRLLTGGRRTGVPRQQTLRATMDWSYGLLSGREQRLLERLSVFAGPFGIEAAEAVCADGEVEGFEVLDLLSALVDRSLVAMREEGGAARYRLLETVRQYGRDRLRERGEEDGFRRRHLRHFLAVAEEVEPWLTGPEQGRWLARLAAEHENFRAAMQAGVELREAEAAARLAGSLARYCQPYGHLAEGRRWLEEALAVEGVPPAARAKALLGAGNLATRQRDHAAAIPYLEQSIALARSRGLWVIAGRGLNALGVVTADEGRIDRARALYEEAREAFARAPGSEDFAAMVVANLGTIALRRGDYPLAERLYGERLEMALAMGDVAGAGSALNNLATTVDKQGDLARAAEYLRRSIPLSMQAGNPYTALLSLAFLAQVMGNRGELERSARLFGAVEARLTAMGSHVSATDRPTYDRNRADVRARLGEAAWERAWAEGQATPIERAMEMALDADGEQDAPSSAASVPSASSTSSADAPEAAEAATASSGADADAREPALRVRALGPLEIHVAGGAAASAEWSHARPRELLLYLLCHPRGRTRDQVGLVFWPDASAAQVKNSFHVLLHRLRKAVGRADCVVLEDETYRVNPALDVWFDVAVLEREVPAALRDLRSGAVAEERLSAALALYRGGFLQDEGVGDWSLEVHDRARRLYVDGLSALADARMERGDHAGAAEALERLVRAEELREDAHRRLMVCLARTGERDRALRHHERLVRLLRDELDAEPEPETRDLHDRIRHAVAV